LQGFLLNTPLNFGAAAATTIPVGFYILSQSVFVGPTGSSTTGIADLANYHPLLGLEFKFGSALTAGAMEIWLESSSH
jgi:hypothetical protein